MKTKKIYVFSSHIQILKLKLIWFICSYVIINWKCDTCISVPLQRGTANINTQRNPSVGCVCQRTFIEKLHFQWVIQYIYLLWLLLNISEKTRFKHNETLNTIGILVWFKSNMSGFHLHF